MEKILIQGMGKNFRKVKELEENRLINKNFIENKNFFSITDLRYGIFLKINFKTTEEIGFQIEGYELCFSNALRRILLSEVSTFCIEKVNFYDNTSVLNDEIIAQRLGLVPIFVPSQLLEYLIEGRKQKLLKLIFGLKVCHYGSLNGNISIYSNSLKWRKYGIFKSFLKNIKIKPVFKDILIAKINPGQKIECECECYIGIGNIHAKFSPVGTSFYRLSPKIKITSEILTKEAGKLVEKCPVKVFDLEDLSYGFIKRLYVSQPQVCTLCRECIEDSRNILPKIIVGRSKEKITFIIESTGVQAPEILFHRAIFLLVGKCNDSLLSLLQNFEKKDIK